MNATITCPHCKRQTIEEMPDDRCVYFYPCPHCGQMLRPKPDDCCVFCSYADQRCPPKTAGGCC